MFYCPRCEFLAYTPGVIRCPTCKIPLQSAPNGLKLTPKPPTFRCPMCPETFLQQYRVPNHVLRRHALYMCNSSECLLCFLTQEELTSHVQAVHPARGARKRPVSPPPPPPVASSVSTPFCAPPLMIPCSSCNANISIDKAFQHLQECGKK